MKKRDFLLLLLFFVSFSGYGQPLQDTTWELVSKGFQFPEGPAWDGDSTLYVSNCYGDWIASISNGRVDTLAMAEDGFGKTNGMWVSATGTIWACDFEKGAILQITKTGKIAPLLKGFQNEPFNRPNDIIQLSNGDLYFTDPKGYNNYPPEGRVFYYNAVNDTLILAADSLNFPNGLAISPLNGKLYVCESAEDRILQYTRTIDGTLTEKEVFALIPGGDPDGIEFDMAGNMYVAHFGTGTLFVLSPNGQVLQQLATPGAKPSNLEFGAPDRHTLYLTEDETNAVYKIRSTIAGVRLR